jgi:hypothetical protein
VVDVWTRGAAIRPVPPYAVVGRETIQRVEHRLASGPGDGTTAMRDAFALFDEKQPEICARMQEILERPLDETAVALGYFLAVAIWLSFHEAFGDRVREVSEDAWRATVDALLLEEDLRKSDAGEPIDLDDLLAIEQPGLMQFVHEQIEVALEIDRCRGGEADDPEASIRDIDVDDVHLVYRTVLLETVALSHAVAPGRDQASPELLA